MLGRHKKKTEISPDFGILSGACGLPKSVGVSGDNYICRKLSRSSYVAAVADGMGTGRIASGCSKFVLESLYQLLRVGLSPLDAISSVNAALPLNMTSECFSTVDLAVFDLTGGSCSIYKAGGAPTVIQRGTRAGILKMPALPVGIIEKPDIKYTTFPIEHGDRYFFLTDGITESPPPDNHLTWATELILRYPEESPRAISERILWNATARYGEYERDDMTVVTLQVV